MRRLLIALLVTVLLITSCSSKFWDHGLLGPVIDSQWKVTMHYDYDGDGDIDTVIWHYTLYTNGDLEMREEVID